VDRVVDMAQWVEIPVANVDDSRKRVIVAHTILVWVYMHWNERKINREPSDSVNETEYVTIHICGGVLIHPRYEAKVENNNSN